MQVLLVNNHYKESTEFMAEKIAVRLRELKADVLIDNGSTDLSSQIPDKLDLIIVLGGDGTILRASRQYALKQTPVLGINMGTVGFLSHIEAAELNGYLEALINGKYTLDKRMISEVDIVENDHLIASVHCLNEVAIKAKELHMISFDINIDEQKLNTIKGDGVIIATPTGSTAYNLSAGGPVLDPDMKAFIITPVAAYKLNTPSIVVSADKIITVTPIKCAGAIIGMDGQVVYDFKENYRIIIKQANITLNLVNFKKHQFFYKVDNKSGR
ncbi:MAG TPA: NAD(+)/NADH kinase [Syntrophomonadaceae bacterium]|nr:NAD(+)/NADH kinase [Syntrophomonadaceae bacterium]HNX28315.1 NAD(+)/NADH kinase [Syntrophomonadaceae bacterium]HPR92522.1 NAD(+)/NADH kinase [Syntrophomonadaceae bacterium]